MKLLVKIVAVLLVVVCDANAGDLKGSAPTGYRVMSVSEGTADTATGSGFTLTAQGSKARLYLLNSEGQLAGPVIAAIKHKGKYYTYADAKKNGICKKSGAKLLMGVKGGASVKLGKIKVKSTDGVGYLASLLQAKNLDSSASAQISNKNKCLPEGTGASLGLGNSESVSTIVIKADSEDADRDGLVDILDVDTDNDGVLNAYDSDTPAPTTDEFRVFSNLKLEIDRSLNQYTQTVATSDMDTAATEIGLAMEVIATTGETSELNCNSLTYCSNGGTGVYQNLAFPEDFDTDSDGFGTMTTGGTGDFQLQPRVTSSSSIAGGDTYIQVVTDSSSTETQIPGMLNFVFRTTPAIRTVSMGGVDTTVTYPRTDGLAGGPNNPFAAPGGWDEVLTLTAYRPQRPGIESAGEGEFVDVGNSLVTIDIPNAPCATATSGGCGGSGPGNCVAAAYSTSDTNLSTDPNGLKDNRADQDTDTANPTSNVVSFSIDLEACLAANSITWSSGQKLAIDLQFRNSSGDNAAQKFYIAKP